LESRLRRESEFFQKIFSENKVRTVLDCACGTGHHVIMLSEMGYEVKGSDLSLAMLRKAKTNSKMHGVKVELKMSDFRDLTHNFNERFDAIICVGDSLPHLLSDGGLIRALREMYALLRSGGILILEQRNYDRLAKTRERFIPMAMRDDEFFFYVLDYSPKKIVFNVVNLQTKAKSFKVYSFEYNPLRRNDLIRLLREVGFKGTKIYGSFQFKKYDADESDDLIAVCKRSAR
jgi:glycine/sarcosine N-methyltransferase